MWLRLLLHLGISVGGLSLLLALVVLIPALYRGAAGGFRKRRAGGANRPVPRTIRRLTFPARPSWN